MLDPRSEDFLTVDDVAITLLAREGRDPRRVAPRLRLRDRHRLQPQAAGRDLWQVPPFLRLGSVSEQRAHRVHLRVAGRRVAAGGVDLLHHDARLDDSESGAAVLGWD